MCRVFLSMSGVTSGSFRPLTAGVRNCSKSTEGLPGSCYVQGELFFFFFVFFHVRFVSSVGT